ncbi:DUF3656 domain-containing protein [Haloimpatiens sp. FM7315]|uniref:U32 family peptidase n=1 Tax=Haloimpatiens sp. FM7315 TaxID=3298609 RepID=UPI0035A32410
MKKVELLAPAGSLESLYAAVNAGADAVYLGGCKFSARAYASNFNEENMKYVVSYCHVYKVKVYITVNTLIKEKEMPELIEYIGFLYKIGVDALIVQDMGAIKEIKRNYPDFEIHASTQMTIHNGEGAKFLKDLGIKRVVLSRELTLDEIKYISKDLNIETEVFIHGALCICYSGQCLMSSLIGGRSGNRGRCAQPCRLPYTLIDKISGKQEKAYMLSPKDICTLDFLEEIIKTGTSSLKIEGRMKRPEYVAGVVSIYRKAIDSIYEKGYLDKKEANKDRKTLLQLFNRQGFSDAYMFKNKGRDMMALDFPKNTGIFLGVVGKDSYVKLKENIELQDGVRVANDGFEVSKIIKDGREVEKAFVSDKVKLLKGKYKNGDELYKTKDASLLNELGDFYKNPYAKRIKLPLFVKFSVGENIELSTKINGISLKSKGSTVEKALKKPVSAEKIIENLSKTKDTPFEFEDIKFLSYDSGFIPISSINEVRRELIEKIYLNLDKNPERNVDKYFEINSKCGKLLEVNEVFNLVCVNNEEQLKAALEMDMKNICLDLFFKNSNINLEEFIKSKRGENQKIFLRIPNIIKEEFQFICDFIDKNIGNINGIVTGNLGIISKFKDKLPIIGDYKLNIFNGDSLDFYSECLNLCAISPELNKKDINDLLKNSKYSKDKIQFMLYGKLELMVSEYCPIGGTFGLKNSNKPCQGVCKYGKFYIKDRTSIEFPVLTDKFCRSHILNSVSNNLIPNLKELKAMGIKSFRLDFTDEDYEETKKVLKAFKEEKWVEKFEKYTRGHYKRGVE